MNALHHANFLFSFFRFCPVHSTKKQEGESDWETEQRRKAQCVWLAGRKGVTELEAASAIIGEAKTIIQQELGLRIDWQSGAEADASAATDGCEDAEDLSASRTGLQQGKEASSTSKTSPLLSSRSSSSSASRRGSPSTGAEPGKATDTAEDSETSPPSSKRKRKSAEGRQAWETPAAVSRSTRVWPRRSAPQRTGGRGTKAACVKSPPPSSGGRDAGSRSGPKSSVHSPKDVSFFGQVVVSPPASIRRTAQNAPRSPPGAEVAAGTPDSGGRASASTPTTSFRDTGGVRLFSRRRDSDGAERSVVPRPGANRRDVGASQMREESHFDRLSSGSSRCASTTSTTTKAACGPSVKERSLEGKLQAPDIVPRNGQTCKGSNIHGNPGDGRNGSENMNNNRKMATDRENPHPKSADVMNQALPKENGSNICNSRLYHCSTARPGHPLKMPDLATNRTDKVPESAQGKASAAVSSVPDRGEDEDASNCFDDSLILNTQTDNLLLGRLSDSSSVSDKSFENAIASTPLLPPLSAREAGRVVGKLTQPPSENTEHATVPPDAGSPAGEKGTGRASKQSSLDEGSAKVNVSALPPGEPAPELFGEQRGVDAIPPKQQRELAHPPPPSPPRPAPPPQLDVDHLTEDMFGSPFVSPCAPSGNQRRLSEASGSARNKGGTVGEEDTSRNGRDRRQLQGRGDDAATDTRGDSEADASAELIAASNYERLPYAEEGVIGNSSDVSYQGLGISHDAASAGRLVCPDGDPEEREEGGDDPEGPSLAGDLGSKCVAEYDIREDLAIAMNLSESFSAAISSPVARLSDGATVGPPARQVKRTTEGCDPDGFSASFTSSMMEKAFANDSFCDPAKEACPQMPITPGDAASQKERAKGCARERSSPEQGSLQPLPARENSKRRDGRENERNRSAGQAKSDRHSHGSASGQSDGEFVPPTPPDETSASASNPCVRRTPLRTCRARGEASRQLGQAAAGARTEGRTAAGAHTEGRTAAGAHTEGRTAAGAHTEGRTAAGAHTEGRTAAGAHTEGKTAAGAHTEGRTAAGARTEGKTAAGAHTEGKTAAGAHTEGKTAAGAHTEGRTAAGAHTEGRTAAGAHTEGKTAAGAHTEGKTAAGAHTEGRTAAGARTEGRTAAGARTEGKTAAGARTEGKTAAGAHTEGRTAAGARTEGRTAAGARTEGRTAAGAHTEGKTAAGAHTEGKTAAGRTARTEGRTAAGAHTEGRTAAGARTEGRTAAGAHTEGKTAAGAHTEGRTAAGAHTEGRTAAGAHTEGRTAAGARTEGKTAAGAHTEGKTAAGAHTEGKTAAGAHTEGKTAAGAHTEGRTAAGARTEGRTAAGARTEGKTAAGARTEGKTAAGAHTEGRTAAGARTEGRTAAGARTEGRTAAGAHTEGKTAAGAHTEGKTAAGARTEGRTAAGAHTEGRTAAGARTEGRTAAGAHTEGKTAAGARTEGKTAAGAHTEGRTAAGARTEGRTAAGARTEGRTAAGAHTEGKTAAGAHTEGKTAAGARTEGRTAAGAHTEGRTAAGARTEGRTAAGAHTEGKTAAGAHTEGRTAAGAHTEGRTAAGAHTEGRTAAGARTEGKTAAGAHTEGKTAAGAHTEGKTAAGAHTEGKTAAGARTEGKTAAGAHTEGRTAAGARTEGRKRRSQAPRDKENGRARRESHSSEKTPAATPSDDAQLRKKPVAQPSHPLQSRCPNLHPGKEAASVTVCSTYPDSHSKVDAGSGAPVEVDDDDQLTQGSLCIIDVCANAELFATFVEEWRSQPVYAISAACEKKASPLLIGGGIGGNFMQGGCAGESFVAVFWGLLVS